MKILITGGTGFLAQSLVPALHAKGYSLFICSEQPKRAQLLYEGQGEVVTLDTIHTRNYDSIINLAGAGIVDRPWTKKRVDELFNSRIAYTNKLIDKLSHCSHPPKLLLQASAIGYYGFWQEEVLDEESTFHSGIVHQLCSQWESVAQNSFIDKVTCLRFAMVLGKNGGALKKMLLPYKLGLGGQLGHGQQWMSWIAIDDVIKLVLNLLEKKFFFPAINVCAPHPVRQKDFAMALSKTLSRPCVMKIPESVIRFFLKDGADLLLKSQRVISKRLAEVDFKFDYEVVDKAFDKIINGG